MKKLQSLRRLSSPKKSRRRRKRKPTAREIAPSTPPGAALRVVGGRAFKREELLAGASVRKRRSLDDKTKQARLEAAINVFKPYEPPPGVLPAGQRPIAMDSANTTAAISWAQNALSAYWVEGLTFMGYAELANLTVRPEYRIISQVIATECTRKWISFQSTAEPEETGPEGEEEGGLFGEEQDGEQDTEAEGIGSEEGEQGITGNSQEQSNESQEQSKGEQDGEKEAQGEAKESEGEANRSEGTAKGEAGQPDQEAQIAGIIAALADGDLKKAEQLLEQAKGTLLAGDKSPEDAFVEMQQAKQDKIDQKEEIEGQKRDERLDKMAAKEDAKADRIQELLEEMERLNVRDLFYNVIEKDGWFGRAHIYIDTGDGENRPELMTPIGDGRDEITQAKFKQGSLQRLACIEPIWTYPQNYNSIDPLNADWYTPSQWFVMGKQLHASRLLTFVARPVPDILKPAYAFGGLSLSQTCKPYIDNWLQTRQSVNDIIQAFSVMVLSTNLSSVLGAGGAGSITMPGEGSDLYTRLDIFNMLRDNRGVFAIDKDTEEFQNVSAPLSTLDQLQAQAQEHMAAVSRIPLVKLLGISPHGLNASSEGELKAFYDTIAAFQETNVRPTLTKIVHFCMMNLWGEVDEEITFKFEPLWAMTEKEEAEVRKIDAETDDILVNGVAALHPEEVRKRLANDPTTPYEDIDVTDVPEAPVDDSLNLKGNMPFAKGAQGEEDEGGPFGGGAGGSGGGSGNPFGHKPDKPDKPGQRGRSSGGRDAMPEMLSKIVVSGRSGARPGPANPELANDIKEGRSSQAASTREPAVASRPPPAENPNEIKKGLVGPQAAVSSPGKPIPISSTESVAIATAEEDAQ